MNIAAANRLTSLQPGDVIMRPFHISGNPVQKAKMRLLQWAIEHGERKGLGHALLFVGTNERGEGLVIHGTPGAANKNGMELSTIGQQLSGLRSDEVRVLRMSDDPVIRENALRFMRFHYWLAEQGRQVFSFHQAISQPLDLPEPVTFEERTYRSYYKFSCIGAVICAYGLQERAEQLMRGYSAELERQGGRIRIERPNALNTLWVI